MKHPLGYTRRILINLCLRGADLRGRRRAELRQQLPERSANSRALELVAVHDELRAALLQLSPRQRTMLVLRYFDDMSEAEVAKVLRCSTGTVKSTTSRSLSQLRALTNVPSQEKRSYQR